MQTWGRNNYNLTLWEKTVYNTAIQNISPLKEKKQNILPIPKLFLLQKQSHTNNTLKLKSFVSNKTKKNYSKNLNPQVRIVTCSMWIYKKIYKNYITLHRIIEVKG